MPVEWVRLKLDLEAFDDAQVEPYLQRCLSAGHHPRNTAAIAMNRRLCFVDDAR